jgi:hypothetical protein
MNTLDPDIRAIQRKRRQEKRCLACGVPTPRSALCKVCRQTLRYCPRCECVHSLSETSQRETKEGRSTSYCLPCSNIVRNGQRQSWQVYLAEQHARKHPQLSQIIRLYKQGLTYEQIADALDMNRGTLRAVIAHARATNRWPKKLTRGKSWRKGKTNDRAAVAS